MAYNQMQADFLQICESLKLYKRMKKHTLIIKVEHPQVFLLLKSSQDELVDEVFWDDKNDLSTQLLDRIDKFLAKNKIEITELEKVDVQTDQARYTSSRIARAVAKTVNYCLIA